MPDIDVVVEEIGFSALDGFEADDFSAAFACFRRTAEAIVTGQPALRPALPGDAGLLDVARAALASPEVPDPQEAKHFFKTHFRPARVKARGGEAFFTGYYEPVVDGALTPGEGFGWPLLARPADLKTFAADEPRPDWAASLSAARVTERGSLQPYPDRARIEAAIPSGEFRPLVWLRDRVEAFLIHVQGSARVRLADGTMLRLTYAGRNGHPYSSIGRILMDRGDIGADTMSLERLKAWLRDRGQEPGEAGCALMQRNASFIFFSAEPATAAIGPTGGAGVPLTPLRSIAVDRTLWSYGLPFWVEADLPWQDATPRPFRRLMIAQDTGSAIIGPARADLFFGSGDEAGRRAGDIRHHGRFTVLLPRAPGAVR